MPKHKGRGRPKLPKGEAKGRIVPIRFTAATLKTIETLAKLGNQTVSQWIRGTVEGAIRKTNMDVTAQK